MQISIVTLGSLGDLLPFVAIGRTLLRRGHSVRLFAGEAFTEHVEAAGLELVPNMSREEYQQSIATVSTTNELKAIQGFRQGLEQRIEPIFKNVGSEVTRGTDLVIAPPWAFGARIAQEVHDFPMATVHLAPLSLRSTFDIPPRPNWMPRMVSTMLHAGFDRLADKSLGKTVNRFRREQGLAPARGIMRDWWNSPQLVAALFPDWFAPPRDDWPPQTQLFDFACHDGSDEPELPQDVADFLNAGDPPIVFTQPSYMTKSEKFYSRSIEVTQRLGRRAMLLTPHPEQLPKTLPKGIQHFTYAPYRTLLPKVATLVHHGGIGTVAQGLAAGCPQLIVPLNFDQPDNAGRLANLGVGERIRFRYYSVPRVEQALDRLINDPEVRQKCREYAQRCQPEAGLQAAAAAMEQIITPHPVPVSTTA